jgi:uncharacterized membrane protein YfbV (UPF0208 family)
MLFRRVVGTTKTVHYLGSWPNVKQLLKKFSEYRVLKISVQESEEIGEARPLQPCCH